MNRKPKTLSDYLAARDEAEARFARGQDNGLGPDEIALDRIWLKEEESDDDA